MSHDPSAPAHAEHFESLEQQSHAAHLGMWVFLSSEILLFAGLFALYAAYRVQNPEGFALGLGHSQKNIGSINTLILLSSSYSVALAVSAQRSNRRARAVGLLLLTILLGATFVVLKLYEYSLHAAEGILPGAQGEFFLTPNASNAAPFWTLYYLMTGLHVIHVCAGLAVLAWITWSVLRRAVDPPRDHPVALAAMYWHLVDVIWIFLWPLFYLTGGG